jgi:thiol-disulfide isomerase/thioredoxin
MKKRLSLAVFALLVLLTANSQVSSAKDIMNEAYVSAKKENKNIILVFHASWCGWCHKMDRSMNDPIVKKYFDDNYITVHMVVDESDDMKAQETPGANEFRTKYHGEGIGIPFWLVFDAKGNMLADSKMRKEGEGPEKGENTGCPASEKEVDYFVGILKRTSSLKEDALDKIKKRFRMNEN